MTKWTGIVAAAAALALAACATQQSVETAQDRAEQALAASRNFDAKLQAALDEQARREQTIMARLADIQTRQDAASAKQSSLSQQLSEVHGELREQRKTIAKVTPVRSAPVPGTPAPAPASLAAPVSSSAADAMYATVTARARQIAAGTTPAPSLAPVPAVLQHLDYGTYEAIGYDGKLADWSGSDSFKLSFHPAGFVFDQSIEVHLLGQKADAALGFTVDDFHWPGALRDQAPHKVPIAGFRAGQLYDGGLSAPFLDFLGASYFQATPVGKPFGLYARAVAIDTGVSNTAEEFPRFSEFWIGAASGSQLDVVALLTSASIDGAYHFKVLPNVKETAIEVNAALFLTRTVSQLGLAPLTSMYLQGPDSLNRPDTMAKAVHDSDGLLIHSGQGWSWIPLFNPSRLQVVQIPVTDLRGFGLLQRDRKYDDYQSPQDAYQKHPSAWVEPTNDWGRGVIKLVEIPAQYPSNNNIVAFWTPANPPAPKQLFRLAYRLDWSIGGPAEGELGRVLATRIVDLKSGHYAVMIEFGGGSLANLPGWVKVQPTVDTNGKDLKIDKVSLNKIAETGRWRLSFEVSGGGGDE
ncbi:MAG TPA: glucan biosynthesis protein, partial [Gammaproteobacteria bacterium]|nr:glucan biosynthesis protein [Gammaproteobacteria bacterium]